MRRFIFASALLVGLSYTTVARAVPSCPPGPITIVGPDLNLMAGASYNGAIGTLNDPSPSPNPNISIFTVSGPSGPTSATLSGTGPDYTINASYTPPGAGITSVQLNSFDSQNTIGGCGTGTIRVHQLQPSPFTAFAREGDPYPSPSPLTSFSDQGSDNPADFTATCNFGDGTPTAAVTVTQNGPGFFGLTTNHTWAINGEYQVNCNATLTSLSATTKMTFLIEVRSRDGFDMDYLDPSVPADVPVGTVGTIFDSENINTPVTDLEAYIGWQDGIIEVATLTGSAGMFTVTSARKLHLPPGSNMGYSLGVREKTVNGNRSVDCECLIERFAGPSTPQPPTCFRCSEGSVHIIDALWPFSQQISAFANSQWSGIAAGVQGSPFSRETDYTATIDWGDGTATTPGVIHRNGEDGYFEVDGTHTWTTTGSFKVTVQITDTFQSSLTVNSMASVTDVAIRLSANNVLAKQGAAATLPVGQFAVPGATATTADFSATIDWGDGTTASAATITGARDSFFVAGGHTYAKAGVFTTTINLTDKRAPGGTATAKGTVVVADTNLTIMAPGSLIEQAGVAFTLAIPFSDSDATATAAKYSITFGWDDGTADTKATVTAKTGGGFEAKVDHTYAAVGMYDMTVTVTNEMAVGGASVLATFIVKVTVVEASSGSPDMAGGTGNSSSSSCAMGGSAAAGEGMLIMLALFGVALFLRRRQA